MPEILAYLNSFVSYSPSNGDITYISQRNMLSLSLSLSGILSLVLAVAYNLLRKRTNVLKTVQV